MSDSPGWIRQEDGDERLVVSAGGAWTIAGAAALEQRVQMLGGPGRAKAVLLDISEISVLDTAGAWLLCRAARRYEESGASVDYAGLDDRSRPLFDLVAANRDGAPPAQPRDNPLLALLIAPLIAVVERLGRASIEAGREALALLNFVGLVSVTFARAVARPRRFRPVALTNQIERTGLDALPIVGLMAFLIGVVLAYQGATQLRRFGAEIFTIDLMAISILREIGVLLTAIMIAGRSGSAFTAEIGTMKVNEEIAAMRALGLDPIEILVLPRINALVITLPLLTLFADFVGLVGGGAMALLSLDLTATQFIGRLEDAITPAQFMVGMVKAPVFAFLIAAVGCHQGLRVSGGAESVGRLTTHAVVQSIFMVIVADAVFSIMFSAMGF